MVHRYLTQEHIKEITDKARQQAIEDINRMIQEESVSIKKKIWAKKEKWTSLWTMEYARQKGVRKESANAWEQVIRRLCPNNGNF